MNLIFLTQLILLASIANGHLHASHENPEWTTTLRTELESKIQTMFKNYSKQYNNENFKSFLDLLSSEIRNNVKIQIIENDHGHDHKHDHNHDHDHDHDHSHEHDHSHQETPNINANCLRTKLDEIFNFMRSNNENQVYLDQSRFLNNCPYFAHSIASCFSQKLIHNIEYKSNKILNIRI